MNIPEFALKITKQYADEKRKMTHEEKAKQDCNFKEQ